MSGLIQAEGRFSVIDPHLRGDVLDEAKSRGLFRIAGRLRELVRFSPLKRNLNVSQAPVSYSERPEPVETPLRRRRAHAIRNRPLPTVRKPVQPGPVNHEARYLQTVVSDAAKSHASKGSVPEHLITTHHNAIEHVAIGGDEIFGDFAEVIKSARDEILIQTFSWEPDSPGVQKQIVPAIKALQEEARRHPERFKLPLKIRILVNQARGPAAKFMKRKKGNRPPTADYLLPNLGKIDRRLLDIKGGVHVNKVTDALHSKTIVADGYRAAITGANVQRRNHASDQGKGRPAFDTGLRFRGEVGEALRTSFAHNWENGLDTKDRPNKKMRALRRPPKMTGLSETPITVLSRRSNANIADRSLKDPQGQGFTAAIRNAHSEVCIQSPNLNNPEIIKELVDAANRGVQVKLLLSKRFNEQRESSTGAGGTNAQAVETIRKLSSNNPSIDIRWYVPPGETEAVEENKMGDGASHAKFASFDDQMAITGSTNMDNQSIYYADETSIAISGKDNTLYIKNRIFTPAFDRSVSA
ncbi:hypothetical protein EOPP23_02330 [Endozoicomonas sp. OPT23]|uniref:phospholipase D-like domain-containing protein n=1 Tax=Endozoicomonas sp. OPT23 TaxID=2072845 RepID=UPI00129AC64A|nr:phosphatidylserine/phosphatidylglycerophosphate/cardiolipin synthase family protein [Endozoicomonas sp. OPT23]MRI31832.1 hypothetical protein [Endozoicomonas sp. OPT23]